MWQSKHDISKMGWEGDVWPLYRWKKYTLMGKAWTLQAERPGFLIPVSLFIIIIAAISNNKIVSFT